jgi:hypothetical protein
VKILPKPDSERAATCVAIPDWMDKHAPGATDAVLMISREDLSEPQRQRLARLTGEGTRYAWREPARNAKANGKNLSEAELQTAHFELMWEAYRAADFLPNGHSEIEQPKERLVQIGEDAQKLAKKIREVGNAAQLRDLWHLYRHEHHDDELLANLPHCLSMATALDGLADFFRSAAPHYKPQGPVPTVGQPKSPEATKTTVIRKIAETCEKHFGAALYGTVAVLANESLNRKDITANSVRGSLRGYVLNSSRG